MAVQTMEKNSLLKFFEILKHKFFKIVILNMFMFVYVTICLVLSMYLVSLLSPLIGSFLGVVVGFLPFALGGPLLGAVTKLCRDFAREVPGFFMQDFKKALQDNWKQCLAVSVIQYVLVWAIYVASQFYYANIDSWFSKIGLAVCMLVAIFFLFASFYIYMMCVTLKLKLFQIIKNTMIFTMLCFLKNILLTVVLAIWIGFTLVLMYIAVASQMSIVYGLVIAFLMVLPFGIANYIIAFFTFPPIKKYVLDPYYEEHPEETSKSVDSSFYKEQEKELPEFVYHNGKMVHRSALQEEQVFSDKNILDDYNK